MLLEWWEASGNSEFIVKALKILSEADLKMVPWRDGQSLPSIHWWVRSFLVGKHPVGENLLEAITARLVSVIGRGAAPDDLINIIRSVQEYMNDATPDSVEDSIAVALHYEFWETEDAISHLGSEHELSEYLEHLGTLATLTGGDAESGKEIVSQRLGELEEPDYGEHRPSFSRSGSATGEEFGDESMRSLFLNLLR